jgi:hypothetical protein
MAVFYAFVESASLLPFISLAALPDFLHCITKCAHLHRKGRSAVASIPRAIQAHIAAWRATPIACVSMAMPP